MKMSGAKADGYIAAPDPGHIGVLIYGQDAMRVTLKREDLIKNLAGENAEADMRLTRLQAGDLRKDPATVLDALKAVGFFPGHRVVFIEDATDATFPTIEAALSDWAQGDASLIVTAGALRATSKLRKVFESNQNAVAIAVYDDPPSRDSIFATANARGLQFDRSGEEALLTVGMALEPGDLRQMIEKLALYKLGDQTPVGEEDVLAIAPAAADADVDDLVGAVAEGQSDKVGPLMARLSGQGANTTTVCISLGRHFRTLHAAATAGAGPDAALSRSRPPVFGPRKNKMLAQIRAWGPARLEAALGVIMDTERSLRSTTPYPQSAVLERALVRLAMMRPR